jgi:hypothetical protein
MMFFIQSKKKDPVVLGLVIFRAILTNYYFQHTRVHSAIQMECSLIRKTHRVKENLTTVNVL